MTRPKLSDPRDAGRAPPFAKQQQEAPGVEARMDPRPDYGESSYRGHDRLRDRVALITGGDSGIGRAVALAFAREGAEIAFSYLPEEEVDAREAKDILTNEGRRVEAIEADLSTDEGCKNLIEGATKRLGRIDVLVNNAAKQGKSVERFEDLDAERVEHTFRVNIISMFHLVRHALPFMRPGSTIINVASIQAYHPGADILDYAVTKGAIVTFTKGLSSALLGRGIRVNAVAPGPVWTPLVVQSFSEEKSATFGKNSPMERPAQPVELSPAFVFLASDDASYVSGEILGVTGGKLLA